MSTKTRLFKNSIKRHITSLDTFENIIYLLIFFGAPFIFYMVAHFTYLFRDIPDEDLQIYLKSEKRYASATKIWLLTIIAILIFVA